MLLKSPFYSERFTLQTSGRQKEKLTVVLAHSPQIIKRYPEVKLSLKQTQAFKVAYSFIYAGRT